MSDKTIRPPIGTRCLIAWADGARSGVTVAPTGKAVPADQVNVMRDGDGSIVTVNIGQLGTDRPRASFDPRSPSMRLWHALVGRGVDADEATELMNGYAHELAERQRDMRPTAPPGFELRREYADAWRDGAKSAAEMIDPEVKP